MKIKCNFCNGKCIKNGFQSNGNQRYKCCVCKKRQQIDYGYNAYKKDINQEIVLFTKEGLGIRSTARILKISATTLLKRIVSIARNIAKPIISRGKTSEVDELCTYIRHKTNYIWLVYALEKNSLKPFDLGLQRTILIKIFLFAKLIIIKRLPNEIYFIQIILKTVRELSR